MTGRVILAILRAPFESLTWRDFLYALVTLVLAVPAFVLPILGLVGSALSLLMIGLPILITVLVIARGVPAYFRWPARALLGWDWTSPPPSRGRLIDRALTVIRDGRRWRALAYCLVKLSLAASTVCLSVVLIGAGVYGLTSPLWWITVPVGPGRSGQDAWPDALALAASGLIALLAFPWVLRLMIALDHLLAEALLAPTETES